ncbi:hypothetical protein [Paenibacillus lautus]|uniref:hypothetical protein n=1 Tax=Paenibacillus lautus TaxID=1401 RepID=UPI001C11CAD6|nr:hypothetical protein [Paenibacillus lautus]MBU5346333.1 hypothetical protein [Paenibacillus lautus]
MKKIISVICIAAVMSISTSAWASGSNVTEIVQPTVVEDFEKIPHKEFQPQMLLDQSISAITAAPHYVANSTCEEGWFVDVATAKSTSYTSSEKKTQMQIDRIVAKGTFYKDGAFNDSQTDDQKKSSYAGVVSSMQLGPTADGETYGSHTFEHAGYQTWNTTTYAD